MCSNGCGDLRNDVSVFYCDRDAQACFRLDYDGENYISSLYCLFKKACVKPVETASISYRTLCVAIFCRSTIPVHVDDVQDCVLPTPLPTSHPAVLIIEDTSEKCSDHSDCTAACVSIEAGTSLYDCPDGDNSCVRVKLTTPYNRYILNVCSGRRVPFFVIIRIVHSVGHSQDLIGTFLNQVFLIVTKFSTAP